MLNENVVKLLKSGMWDLVTCADGEPNAAGYIRLNLAMPHSIIETGLVRMVNAIREERGRTPKPAEYRQA